MTAPNLERLREVGLRATERFNRRYKEFDGFRIYRDGLRFYIEPKKVPRTELVDKIRQLRPHRAWNAKEEPTHAADFDLYRRVLKRIESLGFWVGHIKETTHDKKPIWHPLHHDAAHVGSRLRLDLRIEYSGQIQINAYQDGLIGPGRKNGPKHSIETHDYALLGHREQLRWRLVVWSLRRWLLDRDFIDNSEVGRDGDPYEFIEDRVRTSGHFGGEDTIFTPRARVTNPGRDDRDVDGKQMVNGDTRYVIHRGRYMRCQVFYYLNMMWWVVAGGEVWNYANFDIGNLDHALVKLRRWFPVEARLDRLKRVLHKLVEQQAFERAAQVRDVIKAHELQLAAKNDRRRKVESARGRTATL